MLNVRLTHRQLTSSIAREDARRAAASALVKRRGQVAAGVATEWRPARYPGRGTRTRRRRALPAAPPWRRRPSFQVLLNAVRRARGRELLADPALDIDEVAFLLGYEGQNSFFRAFRKRPLACEPSKAGSRVSCKLDPEITRVSWDRGVYRTTGHPQVIARSLAVSPKQSRRCS
jgi:hypothetical protein